MLIFLQVTYIIFTKLPSKKDCLREWWKLNKNVLTGEASENAVFTESVFETTSGTTTTVHAELTDESDYLFDTTDSIHKNLSDIDDELNYPLLSENEDTYEDENAIEIKTCDNLHIWYGKHNISREGMNELLKIMLSQDLPLPLDTRTLLR